MTGKFLKKIISAMMCTALGAGVLYSGSELAGSLSATVFAEEISESENEMCIRDRSYIYLHDGNGLQGHSFKGKKRFILKRLFAKYKCSMLWWYRNGKAMHYMACLLYTSCRAL